MDEMYGITQPAKYKLWVIDKIYKIDDEWIVQNWLQN